MGVADAMAEEFTYFCRCDVCRCSLFRGDNWYHKPGTNYDLCARDFAKLSAEERQVYVNIATSSDLGSQQNEYILEINQYLARCDQCRKAVSLGDDWYHKQAEGNYDLCAHHWKDLPDATRNQYVNVYASKVLGERKLQIGRILSANKQILPKKLADPPPLSATASSRTMWLLVCNVAGFLAPEPWIAVQQRTNIPELKVTTAQEPDYAKLMALRSSALRTNGVKLQQIVDIMDGLELLPGATQFLAWLKPIVPRTFMITDGPEEYALPIFDQLEHPMVFCNFFEADDEGFLKRLMQAVCRVHSPI
eukprot:g23046.t1